MSYYLYNIEMNPSNLELNAEIAKKSEDILLCGIFHHNFLIFVKDIEGRDCPDVI